MISLYNSPFEISLRMLMLLRVFSVPVSGERLYLMDFLCTNGKRFHFTDTDLFGSHSLQAGALPALKKECRQSMALLTAQSLAEVQISLQGILYTLTEKGNSTSQKISGHWASQYTTNAAQIISALEHRSDTEILTLIFETLC